jgi:hypothetical protein
MLPGNSKGYLFGVINFPESAGRVYWYYQKYSYQPKKEIGSNYGLLNDLRACGLLQKNYPGEIHPIIVHHPSLGRLPDFAWLEIDACILVISIADF